jgi:hypothetical protein
MAMPFLSYYGSVSCKTKPSGGRLPLLIRQENAGIRQFTTQEIPHQLAESHFRLIGMCLGSHDKLLPKGQVHPALGHSGTACVAFHAPNMRVIGRSAMTMCFGVALCTIWAHIMRIYQMARPRRHKTPARLNITLDAEVKNAVMLLAAEKGLSVGQLIARLVRDEAAKSARRNRGNGDSLAKESDPVVVRMRMVEPAFFLPPVPTP